MENIYDYTETQIETEEDSSEFFDLKIITDGTNVKSERIKRDEEDVSVSCFILLTDSKEMSVQDGSYNLDLLGNPMFQYVVRACPTVPSCIKFDEDKESVLLAVKPYIKDTEYTLVLFSDTPLVTKANILNILDFAKSKGLNVCKLSRGYVFKNEYIKRVDEIYAPSTYYFDEEDFLRADTYKNLNLVSQKLRERIIYFHMENGVYFKAPENIYVDANVSIGQGTVIDAFVRISGDTDIGENCLIKSNTTLINAKVFEGAIIEGAYVDSAIIKEKAKIKHGAKLFSQTAIKEGVVVSEDSIISNAIIGEHSMVGRNTVINYLSAEDNVCIGDNCKIVGTESKPVTILKGAKLEDMVSLMHGVKISEAKTISFGEIIKAGEIR